VPWLLVALLIAAAALAGWWAYNEIQEQLDERAPVGVPLVVGLREAEAVALIEDRGLEAEIEEQPSLDVEEGRVIEQSPREGTSVTTGTTVTITVSTGPREVEVPDLVGLTYGEAVDALNEVNLEPRRVEVFSQRPPGQVVNQDPKAGEQVDEGTEVEVRVSKGVRQVEVPNVLGESESGARAILEDAGFEVAVTEAPSDSTPEGNVSGQSPSAGTEAPQGSTVSITISTGPELVTVPDVLGQSLSSARAEIRDAGLRPSTICEEVSDPGQVNTIIAQDPGGGSQASGGSTVTIVVGRLFC
jgi:serine/threonine-protein kinase